MKKLVLWLLAAVLLILPFGGCNANKDTAAAEVIGTADTILPKTELKQQTNREKIGYQLNLPVKGEEIAVITMASGESIKLRFFPDEAPKAVYNFKLHALKGYYDGLTFHRVIQGFMIQGGDPAGNGTGGESVWGESFEDEFNANLLNLDGAVSRAKSGANTNGSQFFINNTEGNAAVQWDQYQQIFEVYKQNPEAFTAAYGGGKCVDMDKVTDDMKKAYEEHGGNLHLDGYYSTDGTGHTVFAQVFEGMDVVSGISAVKTDANAKPLEDVVIEKIEIVPYEG